MGRRIEANDINMNVRWIRICVQEVYDLGLSVDSKGRAHRMKNLP